MEGLGGRRGGRRRGAAADALEHDPCQHFRNALHVENRLVQSLARIARRDLAGALQRVLDALPLVRRERLSEFRQNTLVGGQHSLETVTDLRELPALVIRLRERGSLLDDAVDLAL